VQNDVEDTENVQ